MLTDDWLRSVSSLRTRADLREMAREILDNRRELLAARKVIAAARQNCPAFDGPPCPCLVCAALRDYDEATR